MQCLFMDPINSGSLKSCVSPRKYVEWFGILFLILFYFVEMKLPLPIINK